MRAWYPETKEPSQKSYSRSRIFGVALDRQDKRIVKILQTEGRITNSDLAGRIGLTAAPTLARVNKLESTGVIRGYAAQVDRRALDLPFLAFASVILRAPRPDEHAGFLQAMMDLPEVLECHHMAGDEDYLLKVVTRGPQEYEALIMDRIGAIPQVQRIKTMLVLSTGKSTTALPVGDVDAGEGG